MKLWFATRRQTTFVEYSFDFQDKFTLSAYKQRCN